MEIIFWIFAFSTCQIGLEYHSKKPFSSWCRQRKLYFSCWSLLTLTCIVRGFQPLFGEPIFYFWIQVVFGIQLMLLMVTPCTTVSFNKGWPKVMRNLFFVSMGTLFIYQAFQEIKKFDAQIVCKLTMEM